jgi:hypothetical protein
MSYTDHLLGFPNESAALGVLMDHHVDGVWKAHVFPGVRPILARAIYDENGEELTPEEALSGYWIMISMHEADAPLRAAAAFDFAYVRATGKAIQNGKPMPEINALIAIDGAPFIALSQTEKPVAYGLLEAEVVIEQPAGDSGNDGKTG